MPETSTPPAPPVNQVGHAVVITKSEKPMAQLLHEQEMERLKTTAKLRREQ